MAIAHVQNESENFICSISNEIMFEPFFTADGQSYEREEITRWLENNNTSPQTGENLSHKNLVPNFALKNAINNYLIRNPHEWNNVYLPASLKEQMLIALNHSSWKDIKNLILQHPRLLTELLNKSGFIQKQKDMLIKFLTEQPNLKQLIPSETLAHLFSLSENHNFSQASSSAQTIQLIADSTVSHSSQEKLSSTVWWLVKCGATAVTAAGVFYYFYNNSASLISGTISAINETGIAQSTIQFTKASLEVAAGNLSQSIFFRQTPKIFSLFTSTIPEFTAPELKEKSKQKRICFPSVHELLQLKEKDFSVAVKEFVKALEYYDEAIALNPQDVEAKRNKKNILAGLWFIRSSEGALLFDKRNFSEAEKKFKEALQYCEDALALDSQNVEIKNRMANMLANLGTIRSEEANILIKRKSFSESVRKLEEALRYYEKALALDPENINTRKKQLIDLSNMQMIQKNYVQSKKFNF